MTWEERMIEGLLLAKKGGQTDFAIAWRAAKRRALSFGDRRPKDSRVPSRDDPDWLPPSVFFERACEREWYGLVRADYKGLHEAVVHEEALPHRRYGAGMKMIA